jgi:hypothetical protein
MVAHLAGKVRGLEAHLAAAGILPAQEQLPSGAAAPDHILAGPHRSSVWGHIFGGICAVGIFAAVTFYTTMLVQDGALAPRDHGIIAIAFGGIALIVGYVAMRQRRAWTASFATAISIATWSLVTWKAWAEYEQITWSVGLGIGALLLVLSLVMGKWIDRFTSDI